MNVGFWACAGLFVPFFMTGILFAAGKEKAAKFISGFGSLPKEEQEWYDKARLSKDMRNQCFLWSGIMLAGAALCYWISSSLAILAFAVWLVLFFREVHMDSRKAFEKYLIK